MNKPLKFFNIFLSVSIIGFIIINQILMFKISKAINNGNKQENSMELTGDITQDAIKIVISMGTPDIYGAELGLSFDDAQGSINILKQFDPGYGRNKIILTGENLKRYINVGLRISCEYCCGAKSIVFKDGRAACGCAHSQAMRGLIAYLIQNHGAEYNNDNILRELARWKGLYFPKQMIKKFITQIQSGQFTPDIASLIMGIDTSRWQGQNTGNIPLPSEIENLPSMVGGC